MLNPRTVLREDTGPVLPVGAQDDAARSVLATHLASPRDSGQRTTGLGENLTVASVEGETKAVYAAAVKSDVAVPEV